jgi:hypothetical protein
MRGDILHWQVIFHEYGEYKIDNDSKERMGQRQCKRGRHRAMRPALTFVGYAGRRDHTLYTSGRESFFDYFTPGRVDLGDFPFLGAQVTLQPEQ